MVSSREGHSHISLLRAIANLVSRGRGGVRCVWKLCAPRGTSPLEGKGGVTTYGIRSPISTMLGVERGDSGGGGRQLRLEED